MARFAANLSTLFTEVSLLDRIDRAAAAGFRALEVQLPYAVPAKALRARLDAYGLPMVLHNLPAGDWEAGDRGVACDPARRAEFRDGIGRAIDYAGVLGVTQLNCLAGRAGTDEATARATLVENIGEAAATLRGAGLRLMIEPVNSYDVPGFWLDSVAKASMILDEVASDNLALQFDIYHVQRAGEAVLALLERNLRRIGHIQFADCPGRHEPGTGALDFKHLFGLVDRLGYSGWIGAEYLPAARTEDGLGWLETYGAQA